MRLPQRLKSGAVFLVSALPALVGALTPAGDVGGDGSHNYGGPHAGEGVDAGAINQATPSFTFIDRSVDSVSLACVALIGKMNTSANLPTGTYLQENSSVVVRFTDMPSSIIWLQLNTPIELTFQVHQNSKNQGVLLIPSIDTIRNVYGGTVDAFGNVGPYTMTTNSTSSSPALPSIFFTRSISTCTPISGGSSGPIWAAPVAIGAALIIGGVTFWILRVRRKRIELQERKGKAWEAGRHASVHARPRPASRASSWRISRISLLRAISIGRSSSDANSDIEECNIDAGPPPPLPLDAVEIVDMHRGRKAGSMGSADERGEDVFADPPSPHESNRSGSSSPSSIPTSRTDPTTSTRTPPTTARSSSIRSTVSSLSVRGGIVLLPPSLHADPLPPPPPRPPTPEEDRAPVIHGPPARFTGGSSSWSPPAAPGTLCRAHHTHTPHASDELELTRGAFVHLLASYEDGWVSVVLDDPAREIRERAAARAAKGDIVKNGKAWLAKKGGKGKGKEVVEVVEREREEPEVVTQGVVPWHCLQIASGQDLRDRAQQVAVAATLAAASAAGENIPDRPPPQRPDAPPPRGSWGDHANQFTFNFGFGLFPALLGMQFAFPPAAPRPGHRPTTGLDTELLQRQGFLSRLFLMVATMVIFAVILS
ncbi:hypothetical protein BDK51DRAFT_29699 [Blyttiomyces helicus]|uniref:SH3 domain-containing protein n=1 Tax=Blyttiomyces helicus TaxID=388810 RepID=A0A4P9W8Z4_9FUNG|nr:hypothetical protein BDK51DRAFT_29699 [Blyttiomyces helicus]|eukprot:RKO87943.1 hypothetical protein BDK51DRAFT_29699 [Blyttiomyces helicus]